MQLSTCAHSVHAGAILLGFLESTNHQVRRQKSFSKVTGRKCCRFALHKVHKTNKQTYTLNPWPVFNSVGKGKYDMHNKHIDFKWSMQYIHALPPATNEFAAAKTEPRACPEREATWAMSTHSGQRWSVQHFLKSSEMLVFHKDSLACLQRTSCERLVYFDKQLLSIHISRFSFPCTSLNMNSAVSSDAAFNSNSQAPSLSRPAKKCIVNCISLTHFWAGAKAFLLFNHMALACAEGL